MNTDLAGFCVSEGRSRRSCSEERKQDRQSILHPNKKTKQTIAHSHPNTSNLAFSTLFGPQNVVAYYKQHWSGSSKTPRITWRLTGVLRDQALWHVWMEWSWGHLLSRRRARSRNRKTGMAMWYKSPISWASKFEPSTSPTMSYHLGTGRCIMNALKNK